MSIQIGDRSVDSELTDLKKVRYTHEVPGFKLFDNSTNFLIKTFFDLIVLNKDQPSKKVFRDEALIMVYKQ